MTRLVVALCVALLMPLAVTQKAASRDKSLQDWAAASQSWLQGQVTPNRVVPNPDPGRRRLLISYGIQPKEFPQGFHRSATYDNALAAVAFLITGQRDRAAFTLHALARLVRADGSLWFGYNTANSWPDEADHESAVVRGGAVAWAGYAFTFYLIHQPPCAGDRGCARERAFFLETAERLAKYLLSLQVNDSSDHRDGLLRLGYGSITLAYRADTNQVVELYQDEPALGISTENNISAWFFLRQLAMLTGESRWSQAAERLGRGLLRGMWNDSIGQFNQGFESSGVPDRVKALDCASWGALFLLAVGETEKARRALGVVESYYAVRNREAVGYRPYFDHPVYAGPEVGRFFFPDNPGKQWRELPLVWSEGTLGVGLAYFRIGQAERARQIVLGLGALRAENGGLRYASMALPHQMADAPSVAASAWLVLLEEALEGNPLAEQIWR